MGNQPINKKLKSVIITEAEFLVLYEVIEDHNKRLLELEKTHKGVKKQK